MSQSWPSGFMLQIYFSFFYVENWWFYFNVLALCSATSYPFGFDLRSKISPLEMIKLIVNTFKSRDKKNTVAWLEGDGPLSRYSEFMREFTDMNIIDQTAGGDASHLNEKS